MEFRFKIGEQVYLKSGVSEAVLSMQLTGAWKLFPRAATIRVDYADGQSIHFEGWWG